MLLPYHVDVPMHRVPFMNWVIIALSCLVSIAILISSSPYAAAEDLILGEGKYGWVGHLFVHADWLHLAGNMLFLWVFGNAVCAKVGNLAYPFVYLGLGLAAAGAHMVLVGSPAIGASGAINGVVGMYVVWYALNEISCLWTFGWTGGAVSISSGWVVLLFLCFDIWGAVSGAGRVAYVAHLGGFFSGFLLALLLSAFGAVEAEPGEHSLWDVLVGTGPRR